LILDLTWCLLKLVQYVKTHLFGYVCLYASCISQICLMFLRASVADLLSVCASAWAILSSVTLKFPRMISRHVSHFSLLVVLTPSQNGFWVGLLVGTYIFSIEVSQASNHFILSRRAYPRCSLYMVSSFGSRTVLLIIKVTSAQPMGSSGSSDVIISRFLLKHSQIQSNLSWFKCISWMASITILHQYSASKNRSSVLYFLIV